MYFVKQYSFWTTHANMNLSVHNDILFVAAVVKKMYKGRTTNTTYMYIVQSCIMKNPRQNIL